MKSKIYHLLFKPTREEKPRPHITESFDDWLYQYCNDRDIEFAEVLPLARACFIHAIEALERTDNMSVPEDCVMVLTEHLLGERIADVVSEDDA